MSIIQSLLRRFGGLAQSEAAGSAQPDTVAERDAPRRIAIAHREGDPPGERPEVRQVLESAAGDATLVHLCFYGEHFDTDRASIDDPAFLFMRLDPPVDLLLVLPQTQGLFPNTFTAAWLGTLLARGEAREIRIARNDGMEFSQLSNALRAVLPATVFDEPDPHWLRLRPNAQLAQCVAALPSSYGFLHGTEREFVDLRPSPGAVASLRNSLYGASRNAPILDTLAHRLNWGPRPRVFDIGGGYGFLGLELAAKGWAATVADNDPTKTELVGPWLVRQSPRPLAVELWTLSMQEIAENGIPGDSQWDVITFFLSLYHAGEHTPALLRRCWQRLAPGGALFIHEVVPEDEAARVDDLQFDRDELLDMIRENAAAPSYIAMMDGSATAEFGHRGAGALLAVKPA